MNPYKPSTIETPDRPRPLGNRDLFSNLVSVGAVALLWFWLLRPIDDRFFGALVLGAACGLFLDGLIGACRNLTPIMLAIVPFTIALPLSLYEWTLEPGDTLGLVVVSSLLFWIESLVPVMVMLIISMATHKMLGFNNG